MQPPAASARNTVSAMRCDVSTFPAATALGLRAFTRHPGGAVTSMARGTPPFMGTSSGKRVRTTNSTAERVTAIGQFTLPGAASHRRRAHIGEQEALEIRRETRRGDDEAFLVQLARARRHASRRHAADIGMVSAHDAVSCHATLNLDRADEREIGKMAAACV